MMPGAVQTILLSSFVGGLVSFITNLLLEDYRSRRVRDRERRSELWEDKKEQIQNVRRMSGFVAEQMTGNALQQEGEDSIRDVLVDIEAEKHILRGYPSLREAIHDFVHTVGSIVSVDGVPAAKDEQIDEIENSYDALDRECKAELKPKRDWL